MSAARKFDQPAEEPSAQDLTEALGGRWDHRTGKGRACCPVHTDKDPSLEITTKNGRTVFTCRIGCDQKAVLAALKDKRVWPERKAKPKGAGGPRRIVATYDYRDEAGELLFQAVRYQPKGFSQRRPDGQGGWINSVEGVRRVIYKLPDVLEAMASDRPIFVAEGEKDVNALWALGIPATCNVTGAGKWRDTDSAFLNGADVVILPDNDRAGREHAEKVAASLKGTAARVRVLELPGLPEKDDVSDWLGRGGTAGKLWEFAESAPNAEEWAKGQPEADAPSLLKFVRQMKLSTKVDAIVKGVLPRGVVAAMYGPTGAGKTFLNVDLGLHAALGLDWFGRRVPGPVPVLLIGLEGGIGMEERVLARVAELGDPGNMFATLAVPALLNRSDEGNRGQATVIAAAEELAAAAGQPVGLIVIDTVARAMAGDDESSTQDMSMFVERMNAIARATGATVVGVHHPGKDPTRGMRGAYALGAGCDVVLRIEVNNDTRQVVAEKMRDAPTGDTLLAFKLRRVVLGYDDDGEEKTTCVVEPCEAPGKAARGRPRNVKGDAVLRLLKRTIDEDPVPNPGFSQIPDGVRRGTTRPKFILAFRSGVSHGATDNQKLERIFGRELRRLQDAENIGVWGDFIWLVTEKTENQK